MPDRTQKTWYGAGRAKCRHCRMLYHFKELPQQPVETKPVEYPVMLCPECNSSDVVVTKTLPKVRHHKCRACDHNFKTARKDEKTTGV